jgi:hypothetical protein
MRSRTADAEDRHPSTACSAAIGILNAFCIFLNALTSSDGHARVIHETPLRAHPDGPVDPPIAAAQRCGAHKDSAATAHPTMPCGRCRIRHLPLSLPLVLTLVDQPILRFAATNILADGSIQFRIAVEAAVHIDHIPGRRRPRVLAMVTTCSGCMPPSSKAEIRRFASRRLKNSIFCFGHAHP